MRLVIRTPFRAPPWSAGIQDQSVPMKHNGTIPWILCHFGILVKGYKSITGRRGSNDIRWTMFDYVRVCWNSVHNILLLKFFLNPSLLSSPARSWGVMRWWTIASNGIVVILWIFLSQSLITYFSRRCDCLAKSTPSQSGWDSYNTG